MGHGSLNCRVSQSAPTARSKRHEVWRQSSKVRLQHAGLFLTWGWPPSCCILCALAWEFRFPPLHLRVTLEPHPHDLIYVFQLVSIWIRIHSVQVGCRQSGHDNDTRGKAQEGRNGNILQCLSSLAQSVFLAGASPCF